MDEQKQTNTYNLQIKRLALVAVSIVTIGTVSGCVSVEDRPNEISPTYAAECAANAYEISASVDPSRIATGEEIIFYLGGGGVTGYAYQWTVMNEAGDDVTPQSSIENTLIYTPETDEMQIFVITVTVTDNAGCVYTSELSITVTP